ncbi:hypothetical protein Tco_0595829 [Tanacetum coccineum]
MKSGDVGVKNSILTPEGKKKRRIHRISAGAGAGAEVGSSCLRAMLRTISLSSATQMKSLGGRVRTYLGNNA